MQRILRFQLVRFCLVGASSTIIDKVIFGLLLTAFPLLPWFISQTISFVFGVTNGFFWNRRWTFEAKSHGSNREQYPKFFISNVIGLILNLAITKVFLVMFTGQIAHEQNPDTRIVMIASICAIPLVVIWNFSAARLWTFRAPKKPASLISE